MTEPRTEAGRRLLNLLDGRPGGPVAQEIFAIEAEAGNAAGPATEVMFHAGADAGERVGRHRALLAIEALVPADGRDDAGLIEHPEEWSFTLPEVRNAIRALSDD